jgi:ferritin-like metal-binding protein YciE
MFEHLNTDDDLFSFRLGTLLGAEHDSLDMLTELEGLVSTEELRTLFAEHAEETRQQISNVERCLELVGASNDQEPSPTTRGLSKEARSLIKKSDAGLHDVIALSGGLETEHYEIATYTTLIAVAEARGLTEVRDLLGANLAQEKAAADKIVAASRHAVGIA